VTGRQIVAFACLVGAQAALGAEPGPPSPAATRDTAITQKNWRSHPRIVAIRALVEVNEGAAKSGRLRREKKRVCEPEERSFVADRVAFRDANGRIRKYVSSEGTDDSAYTMEHHYDEQGRLRFAFGTSGAVNGARVEYRLYFSEDGGLLWQDRRETGPGYTFTSDFPEEWLVRDPGKASALHRQTGAVDAPHAAACSRGLP
jgi:hypothetical protein